MSIQAETGAGKGRPRIETIEQAAAEISRLYAVLGKAAIDLTPKYILQRLRGEENVAWARLPGAGLGSAPTPLLDPVVRHQGGILLGASYDRWSNLVSGYRLATGDVTVSGVEGQLLPPDAITVHRFGEGYDPGSKYAVVGDIVLRSGYKNLPSAPGVGAHGRLEWSAPSETIDNVFQSLGEVDETLLKVIEGVQAYEPPAQP